MVVRQKPAPPVVKNAAKKLPLKRTSPINKATFARILDDEKNAPAPHKPAAKPKRKPRPKPRP